MESGQELSHAIGSPLPSTFLFDHPSVVAIVAALEQHLLSETEEDAETQEITRLLARLTPEMLRGTAVLAQLRALVDSPSPAEDFAEMSAEELLSFVNKHL